MTEFTIEEPGWQGSFFTAFIRIGPVRVAARLQVHGSVSVEGIDDLSLKHEIAAEMRVVALAKLTDLWLLQDKGETQQIADKLVEQRTCEQIAPALEVEAKQRSDVPFMVLDSQPPRKRGR